MKEEEGGRSKKKRAYTGFDRRPIRNKVCLHFIKLVYLLFFKAVYLLNEFTKHS
jgi:hypothetical protein